MANWSTTNTRNKDITDAIATNRACILLGFIDAYLVSEGGWTRIGTGDGTSLKNWSTTTVLSYPGIGTMSEDAWAVWQNADGVMVCMKVETSTSLEIWISPSGGYVEGTTTHSVPPAEDSPPADQITIPAIHGSGSGNFKVSMAYTDDSNSFIVFARRDSGGTIYDELCIIVTKLEDVKTDDTIANGYYPYWFYAVGSTSANQWVYGNLSNGSGNRGFGEHPTQGVQEYYVMEPYFDSAIIFSALPVDPISGNPQRMELLCACNDATAFHIRGKVPGIYRISSAVHNSGDRLDDAGGGVYNLVVLGDYAVPWKSSDNLLW